VLDLLRTLLVEVKQQRRALPAFLKWSWLAFSGIERRKGRSLANSGAANVYFTRRSRSPAAMANKRMQCHPQA
jgi:hypothetical protein